MPDQPETQDPKDVRQGLLQACIRKATAEVLEANRATIVKRARELLRENGLTVPDGEQ